MLKSSEVNKLIYKSADKLTDGIFVDSARITYNKNTFMFKINKMHI